MIEENFSVRTFMIKLFRSTRNTIKYNLTKKNEKKRREKNEERQR